MGRHHTDQQDGAATSLHPAPLSVQRIIKITLLANVILFAIKVAGSIWSLSLALIASTVDSFLDLLSGVILFVTERATHDRDPYKYPQGKSRMEPVGIIVFAAAMGMASLQLVNESLQYMIEGITGTPYPINMDLLPVAAFTFTIGVKLCLFLWCKYLLWTVGQHGLIIAIMQDHRNDLITNCFGFAAALLAAEFRQFWYLDPLGAMILAVCIFISWINTALEQVGNLIGIVAPPEFIGRLTYLAATHDTRIIRIDKVMAYHFGVRYLCEVDIVLSPEAPLRIAHDIGERLQLEIEALDEVERAFVHLDFESTHKPEQEHTVINLKC